MGQILNRRAGRKSSIVDCEGWPQLCSKDNVHVFIESVQGCLDAQKKARKREVQSYEHIGGLLYTIHRKIGSGEFSEVFEASRMNASRRLERFAIKVYRSRNLDRQKSMREEIKVLQKLGGGCKEIVALHQYQENLDSETGTLEIKIVMDLCQGGTLRQMLKSIPCLDEQKTKIIGFQLVQALHHLHTRRIVHCDVKPENILFVSKGSLAIKLADFGNAKMSPNGFSPPRSTSFTMSDIYVAPEILQESAYGTPADMWSLGITLYQCLTNRFPFETGPSLTMKVIEEICTGSFIKKALSSELFPESVGFNAVLFIEKLLRVDANDRMNVIEALNHKWLKTMDVEPADISRDASSRSKPPLMFETKFRQTQLRDSHHYPVSLQQSYPPSINSSPDTSQYTNDFLADGAMIMRKPADQSMRVSPNYTSASSPSFEMTRGTSDCGVHQRMSRAVQAFNSSFQELQSRDRENTTTTIERPIKLHQSSSSNNPHKSREQFQITSHQCTDRDPYVSSHILYQPPSPGSTNGSMFHHNSLYHYHMDETDERPLYTEQDQLHNPQFSDIRGFRGS